MSTPYSLFSVFGIELEYMLVDKKGLNIKPAVDRILEKMAGEITTDYVQNNTGFANELALHVIEVRSDDPEPKLHGLGSSFLQAVSDINQIAGELDARLLPTSMHPWMNPETETLLWPHEYSEVYRQFDGIFNCKRHGWANLQSCQLNLPFADDREFEKLHAAIRILLPVMPALASASPVINAQATGLMNNRLEVYKSNAVKTPLVAGECIPEPVYNKKDYEEKLLRNIYRQIAPYDPQGTLQYEWLNARGAISRFDRNAIEIRVLDMQECPPADVAVCGAISGALKLLCDGLFGDIEELKQWEIAPLKSILDDHIRSAENTVISDRDYLRLWGIGEKKLSSRELWHYLIHDKKCASIFLSESEAKPLETILSEGVLSRRILKALGPGFSRQKLHDVYTVLADCLRTGAVFHA